MFAGNSSRTHYIRLVRNGVTEMSVTQIIATAQRFAQGVVAFFVEGAGGPVQEIHLIEE